MNENVSLLTPQIKKATLGFCNVFFKKSLKKNTPTKKTCR